MAYCAPLGIPHSQFRSWVPDDQEKALAWLGSEKSRCGGCGTYPEEYLDEERRMRSPAPYRVATEICYGCVLLDEKRKEIGENNLVGISMRMAPNPEFNP